MPESEEPDPLSPPAMSSWFGLGPGKTTSRLIGATSCHGSSPDSTAAGPVDVAAEDVALAFVPG
jgi:hypothetical protein